MLSIKRLGKRFIVKPIVKILVDFNIHPNMITIASFFFALISFVFYKNGVFWAGAIFLFLCGISDSIDGEVARLKNQITKLGGFLDSTIDRVNEFIIYFGLFFYYYSTTNYVIFWILLAIFGSMMVSYTRARAEGLGISPQVGIFERFTRFTCLVIGSLLGPKIMVYILIILAVGTIQTTIRRIIYVHQKSLRD